MSTQWLAEDLRRLPVSFGKIAHPRVWWLAFDLWADADTADVKLLLEAERQMLRASCTYWARRVLISRFVKITRAALANPALDTCVISVGTVGTGTAISNHGLPPNAPNYPPIVYHRLSCAGPPPYECGRFQGCDERERLTSAVLH